MRKSVTYIPKFFSVGLCRMWVSLNKRLVNTLYPKFFPVNMIFLEERPLVYNKICMGFNPRGGARGPLSAPRLIAPHCLPLTAHAHINTSVLLWNLLPSTRSRTDWMTTSLEMDAYKALLFKSIIYK